MKHMSAPNRGRSVGSRASESDWLLTEQFGDGLATPVGGGAVWLRHSWRISDVQASIDARFDDAIRSIAGPVGPPEPAR